MNKQTLRVGREFQHLEDLVFVEGTAGAHRALRIIENLTEASLKWDGNPTIYWGRNPAGEFVLVNKNAWGKTECTNPEMLEEFILTSGHGEPWRPAFAESLVNIWTLLETATPEWFRGYVYGDLLFYPSRPAQIVNKSVVFTPNKVTYKVDTAALLGKQLSEGKVCIAAHKLYNNFGDKAGVFFQESDVCTSQDVAVIGQTNVTTKTTIDQTKLASLRETVDQYNINQFLEPVAGLSDLKNIIYTYVNQTSKARKLDTLGDSFFDWLENSKVSASKQARIIALSKSYPDALSTIFGLVKGIMELKNSIIEQLDASVEVQSSTLNEPGGEGYIVFDESVKLVPRHRWIPD